MAKKSKQQQKKRQKTVARRQQKKSIVKKKRATIAQNRERVDGVGSWSLAECWISEDWREPMALTQILVARHRPDGGLTAAIFLVDLKCLGVKSAHLHSYISPRDLDALRGGMYAQQAGVSCAPALAAKVIREGARYAADLGFPPDIDFRAAWPLLEEVDTESCAEVVPLGGKDGRPLFIAGPYDDVDDIMDTLSERLGPDGFHFVAPGR